MINKSTKARYNKTYYYKHRKALLMYLCTKVKCKCGSTISKGNIYGHLKTEKHKKYLRTIEQSETPISKSE